MIQVTVWLHTDEFLFGFTKTKTGAKTAPRAPQLSARVNHGTPAAGVIGHTVSQSADPNPFRGTL